MSENEDFTIHWTRTMPAVSSYLHSFVKDYQEAEDLMQDVGVTLFKKFCDYDPTRPFAAWALGIARIKVADHFRQKSKHPMVFDNDIVELVSDTYESIGDELTARRKALGLCLDKLSSGYRSLLQMRYHENLKPGAIAERIGKKSGAVRVMLTRIRDSLEKCIQSKMVAET